MHLLSFSIVAEDIDSDLSYVWYVDEEEQDNSLTEFTSQFTESGEYQVRVIISDGEYTVEQSWSVNVPVNNGDETVTPLITGIISNYPNPFNPDTNIQYNLKQGGLVSITIYDLKGKVVRKLDNGYKLAGEHNTSWDGLNKNNQGVASGVYYVKMTSADG